MNKKLREAVIKEAMTWLGTPYHRGAKLKGVGVDCGQFLIGVYENVGYLKPGECNPGYYPHEIHLHRAEERYLEYILKYCNKVDEPQPGDIAMFRFGKSSSHSAIVIEWPRVIHSYVRMGVILSDAREALLCYNDGSSRLTGFYRPKRRR
ncbi:MAG TPA: NlpC/P60 family protein [Acetivibrio sp.]|nr:NlpC/P60 family protein [Acetivibrio sp.]